MPYSRNRNRNRVGGPETAELGRNGSSSAHLTLAQSQQIGVTDMPYVDQAGSLLAPCLKHFISCEETGVFTQLNDIKKGVVVLDTGNPANTGDLQMAEGDDAGKSVNLVSWRATGDIVAENQWESPGTKDFIILCVGRAKFDPAQTGYGGGISFYFSSNDITNEAELKIHPYFAAFSAGEGLQMATPVYYPMMNRIEDQVYAVAGVKRGDYLEHWVDGERVGRINVADKATRQDQINTDRGNGGTSHLAHWQNWPTFTQSTLFTGHAAYDTALPILKRIGRVGEQPDEIPPGNAELWGPEGETFDRETNNAWHPYFWSANPLYRWFNTPNSEFYNTRADGTRELAAGSWVPSKVANYPNDMYGFIMCAFEDGMPEDVGAAMEYMKEQWVLGNKVLYPGWVALK